MNREVFTPPALKIVWQFSPMVSRGDPRLLTSYPRLRREKGKKEGRPAHCPNAKWTDLEVETNKINSYSEIQSGINEKI